MLYLSSNMARNLVILLATIVLTISAVGDSAPKGKIRDREGDYKVTVAGDYAGAGQSSVDGDTVKLQADVKSRGGSGALTGSCTINGAHFSGTGNVMGRPAVFKGRVDAPDEDKERTLKGVRLVCTFTVTGNDGRKTYGRLVGYIPAQAAAPEDDRDRGRNKK
jgi:hypothetical protein